MLMRTSLTGNPTLIEGLERVREICLQAYTHSDIPFEKVVEQLEPERDLRRSPLFQVMFVLQNTPVAVIHDLAGVRVKELAQASTTSKFDLTLFVAESEQGLHCQLEYRTDLFEQETITRLLTHFQILLEGVVQNAHLPLSELPLLTDTEREQLLVQWNPTQLASAQDLCLHQRLDR